MDFPLVNFISFLPWFQPDSLIRHTRKLPEIRQNYRNLPYQSEIVRKNDPILEFTTAMTALLFWLSESSIEAIVLGQPVLWKEDMDEEEKDVLWFHVNTPKGPIRPSGKWLAKEMARYNDMQKMVSEQNEAEYVDLDNKIDFTEHIMY